MAALALSFSFFLFLAVVGRATLALCRWQPGVLRSWLLAPAIGLSVSVLCVMVLNQAGLPVRSFARPLTIALGIASIGILVWRRPVFPWRALLPFILVAIFSLGWTGWPMWRFGFGWLSYVNDDYVNYCLAAERFKDFGFWRVPTMEELAGRDITQYYWFMHVPGLMRFGSEITLSWVSAVSGVKSLGAFMPVILGFALMQLSATAALVLHRGRWRRWALVTVALLAVSPLFMLGTLYQLFAQVGGVGLAIAATAILTARLPSTRRRLLPHSLALAIIGAALAIFYPEVSAFAVLSAVLVTAVEWWSDWRKAHPRLQPVLPALRAVAGTFPMMRLSLVLYGCAMVIVLLRTNVLSYVFTILLQAGQGFRSVDLSLSLFPYFMIPTGLANLFGLMPLAVNWPEPYTSRAILAGLITLLVALGFGIRQMLRATPIAALLLAMFVFAIKFLTGGNDFGLYKIAMWMQPAFAAMLACALLKLPWRRVTVPLGVLAAGALCSPTALYYTRVSQGEKAGGITEAKLASILGTAPPSIPPRTRLLTDISNLVAAKVAAFELRGTDLRFISRDYYQQIAPIEYERLGNTLISLHPKFGDLLRTRKMLADRDDAVIREISLFQTSFRAPELGYAKNDPDDGYLLLDEPLGLFNKLRIAPAEQPDTFFKFLPASAVRNHLVFMHSNRGNHYYLGDRNRIAIFQPEADPHTPLQDINGLGRFLVLRVERPDEEFYLRISASKTFLGPGRTGWSPGSEIIGQENVPLPFRGHGAVNRIVGPIRPILKEGAAYIAIDFHETPRQYRDERTGLQSLYNTNVPLDSRKLVAYGRDISALSAREVAALPRPHKLTAFPRDLLFARGLEFSGIFEDGWLSPQSEFILGGGGPQAWARIRGFVPELPGNPLGGGTMKIALPSGTVEVPAAIGSFDWLVPVGENSPTARVALEFTRHAPLPEQDGRRDERPVGGMLQWLEIFPSLPTYTFEFGQTTSARPASAGIDQDGWFAKNATIQLPPFEQDHDVILSLEYPGWSGQQEATLTAHWPGSTQPARLTLRPGAQPLRITLPKSAVPRTLRLETSADFPLEAPDPRRRAGRLVQMELQPLARP